MPENIGFNEASSEDTPNEILHQAILDQNTDAITDAIQVRKANPNEICRFMMPPLYLSISLNKKTSVEALLNLDGENKVNINVVIKNQSALGCALEKQNWKIFEILVMHKDIQITGLTPPKKEITWKPFNLDAINQLFIKSIRDKNLIGLNIAVLYASNLDQKIIESSNLESIFPLAVKEGYANIVDFCLKHQVKPSTKDQEGKTTFELASENRHIYIIEKLLHIELSFIGKNKRNLDVAELSGYLQPIHRALDSLNEKDATVLLCAAEINKNRELVKILLERRGINPKEIDFYKPDYNRMFGEFLDKISDQDKAILLCSAVNAGNIELVKTLLENGANADSIDLSGDSALLIAAKNNLVEIADILLEQRADITHKDKDGRTALFHSVNQGHKRMTRNLTKKGATLEHDNEGNMPSNTNMFLYRSFLSVRESVISFRNDSASSSSSSIESRTSTPFMDSNKLREEEKEEACEP